MWWGDKRDYATGKLIPMDDSNLRTVYDPDIDSTFEIHTRPNPITSRRLQRYFAENLLVHPLDGGFFNSVRCSIRKVDEYSK